VSKASPIEWTDHTFNPWWGCTKVSPGCTNCYAEALARRYGHDVWGPSPRRFFGDAHWAEPVRWDREAGGAGTRARVFCASMADVFEDHPSLLTDRIRLWDLVEATPNLDWLLLTKRPENIRPLVRPAWLRQPRPNVWYGTTVENADYEQRARILARVPAFVRFLSIEPLIGPVPQLPLEGIHWVIVGGESGPRSRPMEPDWVRLVRGLCVSAGVAFFFKQWGGRRKAVAGRQLDGRTYDEFPAPSRSA
jgi:protein gp37